MRFLQSSPLIPGLIVVGTLWFALEARSDDKSKALAAKVAQDSPLTLRDYLADQEKRGEEIASRLDRLRSELMPEIGLVADVQKRQFDELAKQLEVEKLMKRLDQVEAGQAAVLDVLGRLDSRLEALEKKIGK